MGLKIYFIIIRILFIGLLILGIPLAIISFIFIGETGKLELKPKYKLKENKENK